MFRVSVISRVVSESSSDFDYLRLRELDRPYKDKTSQGLQWNQAPFSALAIAADSLATPLGWTALDSYHSIDLKPCSGRSWRLWHVEIAMPSCLFSFSGPLPPKIATSLYLWTCGGPALWSPSPPLWPATIDTITLYASCWLTV